MSIVISGANLHEPVKSFEEKHQKTLDTLCKCGHKLGEHAYVSFYREDGSVSLVVSQCVFCGYDVTNNTFDCSEFTSA